MIFVRICWTLVLYYCLGKPAKVIRQQFKIALQELSRHALTWNFSWTKQTQVQHGNYTVSSQLSIQSHVRTWNNTTMTSPDWDHKTRRGPNDKNRRILQIFSNRTQRNQIGRDHAKVYNVEITEFSAWKNQKRKLKTATSSGWPYWPARHALFGCGTLPGETPPYADCKYTGRIQLLNHTRIVRRWINKLPSWLWNVGCGCPYYGSATSCLVLRLNLRWTSGQDWLDHFHTVSSSPGVSVRQAELQEPFKDHGSTRVQAPEFTGEL